MPEFYMIFARKMPEFYIIIARKIYSRILGGGQVPSLPPPSPTPMLASTCVVQIFTLWVLSSYYNA